MRFRSGGAEFVHADGQTDRRDISQLIVAFRNFSNAPEKGYSVCIEGVTFLDQLCYLAHIKCIITLMFAYNLGTSTRIY